MTTFSLPSFSVSLQHKTPWLCFDLKIARQLCRKMLFTETFKVNQENSLCQVWFKTAFLPTSNHMWKPSKLLQFLAVRVAGYVRIFRISKWFGQRRSTTWCNSDWVDGPPQESTCVHCVPKFRCNWHHSVVALCFLFFAALWITYMWYYRFHEENECINVCAVV